MSDDIFHDMVKIFVCVLVRTFRRALGSKDGTKDGTRVTDNLDTDTSLFHDMLADKATICLFHDMFRYISRYVCSLVRN